MPSALWGHLCAWRALLAGVSKSANEGGVAEEQVSGGSQETWEPWKVQASTPHPSPSALVQQHVSDNQGALTGTIHTLVTKKVTFAGNVPPGSTQGGRLLFKPWCSMGQRRTRLAQGGAHPLPALSRSSAK